MLDANQKNLIKLVSCALTGKKSEIPLSDSVLALAGKQGVASLIYYSIGEEQQNQLPARRLQKEAKKTALQFYHLLGFTRFLQIHLKEAGIDTVVLKGLSCACSYPVPESRRFGDVDLLVLDSGKFDSATEVLLAAGLFEAQDEHTTYHKTFNSSEGIVLELHRALSEQFADSKTNRQMEYFVREARNHAVTLCLEDGNGKISGLDGGFQTFSLLIHMLHHLIHGGISLRLVADWAVLNEMSQEELDTYYRLIRQSGLISWSNLVTETCIHYFGGCKLPVFDGIEHTKSQIMVFLEEIFDSGEGSSDMENHLMTVADSSIVGLMKEFHNQMRINYRIWSKCILLWPILYLFTFIRFVKNNSALKRGKTLDILKSARLHGRKLKRMKVFD